MPDDEHLTQALIHEYYNVKRHFIGDPEERAIILFLKSFGSGDGLGVC